MPCAFSALIGGCSAPDEGMPLVGSVQQASTGTAKIAACTDSTKPGCTTELNQPSVSLSEPFAFASNTGTNGSGVWEMITPANGSGGSFQYGCTRDNYLNWKTFNYAGGSPGALSDFTGAYDSGLGRAWLGVVAQKRAGDTGYGLLLYVSGEPCPASGEPTWGRYYYSFNNPTTTKGADHPSVVYDRVYRKRYLVWGNAKAGGGSEIWIIMKNDDGSYQWWRESATPCSSNCTYCGSSVPGNIAAPSASVDGAGHVHIVYDDQTPTPPPNVHGGQIRHEIFYQNGGGFACSNQAVGYVDHPPVVPWCAGTCPNVATFPQVGNPSCIRENPSPSVATDPLNFDHVVVVAYSSYVVCNATATQETQVYNNSTDGIGAFTQRIHSCPFSWVFPRVVSANLQGAPNQGTADFHLHVAAVTTAADGTILPYRCKSTDGGNTWPSSNCDALSGPYNPKPFDNTCYAGDYQGAAADPGHNPTRSFFAWGQPLTLPNLPYAIYGNTDDL